MGKGKTQNTTCRPPIHPHSPHPPVNVKCFNFAALLISFRSTLPPPPDKLLLDPSKPILPDSRFASRGSDVVVHLVVDRKNRVYACVTVDDVPPKVAFSFLEEVRGCGVSDGGCGKNGGWGS